jgi:hypothetical protein
MGVDGFQVARRDAVRALYFVARKLHNLQNPCNDSPFPASYLE